MRKIIKSAEPNEWKKYRLTPNVNYQATPELRISQDFNDLTSI